MATFQNIIYLNNQAVALLKVQDVPRAIETSYHALKCCSGLFAGLNGVPCGVTTDSLDQCMLLSSEVEGENAHNDEGGDIFIYRRGIELVPSHIVNPSIIVPIVIFNLALSYDLMATTMERYNSNSFVLRNKARQLYYQIMKSIDVGPNVLFQFAITNNVAVIEQSMGEIAKAKNYFDFLMTIYLMMVDRGQNSLLKCIRGFPSNILSSFSIKPSAAAAA